MARPLLSLVLVGLFVAPPPAQAKGGDKDLLRDYILKTAGRQAYGVYVQNAKIGWMVSESKLDKHDGKEVAVSTENAYFELHRGSEKLTMEVQHTTRYSLEGEGAILSIEEVQKEGKRTTIRRAVAKGDKLVITTESPAGKSERTVPLPGKNLARMRKLREWLLGTPEKGATFEDVSVALDENEVASKSIYTFLEKKSVLWGGVKTDVYHVRIADRGAVSEADVKADGTPIKGTVGGLLEIRAEEEALAKKLDAKGVDLLAVSSISVDKDLGDPGAVEALTLKVEGLGDYAMPANHRQKLIVKEGGSAVLELKRDFKADKGTPLTDEQRAKMLVATPSVQSDSEPVRKLAKEIVGDEKDPLKIAEKIKDWVHGTLRQTMAANASTALEVLKQKAGDCTEHTLLFVTLARAAGLPAREVGGVAFVSADRPLFGWHAWAEVHDGRQWVTVDPTWNQLYVDATHVKFSDSPDDWSWLNVLGRVKFKVVDFKKSD